MAKDKDAKETNPIGRPLAFTSVADLDLAIQLYFDKQDPHVETHMVVSGLKTNGETMFEERSVITDQRPYTMAGLARSLGVDRRTLLNYKNRDEFFPSIQAAIDRCEEYAESQLFSPYSNGAKFSLINNYQGKHVDWSDKQLVDHTSAGERLSAAPIIISDIAARVPDASDQAEAA